MKFMITEALFKGFSIQNSEQHSDICQCTTDGDGGGKRSPATFTFVMTVIVYKENSNIGPGFIKPKNLILLSCQYKLGLMTQILA